MFSQVGGGAVEGDERSGFEGLHSDIGSFRIGSKGQAVGIYRQLGWMGFVGLGLAATHWIEGHIQRVRWNLVGK